MYTGAALSFGLIRACRGGLVLYCSVLSDAGGETDGSSAIFERSLLRSHIMWRTIRSSCCLDPPPPHQMIETFNADIYNGCGVNYSWKYEFEANIFIGRWVIISKQSYLPTAIYRLWQLRSHIMWRTIRSSYFLRLDPPPPPPPPKWLKRLMLISIMVVGLITHENMNLRQISLLVAELSSPNSHTYPQPFIASGNYVRT